jgi:protein phosphatase
VAELVESGVLTPEEAERHPQRSAITRAVGTERAIEADVFSVPGRPDDLFLLCSDGLTDMLTEDEIAAAILGAGREPTAVAKALVDAANEHGGEDNITVVLFELAEGEPDAVAAEDSEEDAKGPALEATLGDPDREVRTHGAGPGGRLTALASILVVVVVGVLALYWAIKR